MRNVDGKVTAVAGHMQFDTADIGKLILCFFDFQHSDPSTY